MTWFYATSVTVANGQTVVAVNSGDDIQLAQSAGGLIIGTQPAVEIKRTFLDGSNNKKIELSKPWQYGTQTNQPAMAFPTDGDLAAATAVLKQLIDGFTLATQADAQAGTENTKPMTALRVKQAMDALLGTASKLAATTSTTDATQGRALRVGDFGIGGGSPNINNWASMGAFTQFVTMSDPVNAPDDINEGGNWWHVLKMHSHNTPTAAIAIKTHYTGGFPLPYPELWLQNADPTTLGYKTRMYSTRNAVGSVGFLNGGNSGALIERGSNANGEYRKFADGTLICTAYRAGDLAMSGGYGITGLYYGGFTWDFPAVFAAPPQVSGSGSDPSRIGWVSAYNISGSSCSPVYFSASSNVNPCGVHTIAVGRWRA